MMTRKFNNLNMFIFTFGQKVMKVKNGIPIEVGAANRQNFLYSLHDDTGDNISNENEYYGELTGLYWVWKNVKFSPDDLIGFCHYNKSLEIPQSKIMRFFSQANRNAWITLEPGKSRCHDAKDELDAITDILREDYPKYYKIWCELYNLDGSSRGDICRGGNIFITTKLQMDRYCTFLFDVLKKMRNIVGDKSEIAPTDRRYAAYMAVRLLSVYITVNNCQVMDAKVRYKQRYLKLARYITNKLHIDRDSGYYKWLRDRFGYKSSYGRKI